MEFLSAKEYIDGLNRFGSVLGLDNIYRLLEKLNNPQNKLSIIHVAGTNGKGSTITYMSSILQKAGYLVGCYTSPVVFEYLEKYQINGENISKDDFVSLVKVIKPALLELNATDCFPTVFEVETAMAFLYFVAKKVDIVILETGMGGDSDATNVLSKVSLSVITSISYDHMAYLGNSILEIAMHKAGIIKKDCPVVVNANDETTLKVLKKVATSKNAKLYCSKKTIKEEYVSSSGQVYTDIHTLMSGTYQAENIALAIEAMEALNENYSDKFNINKAHIVEGIKLAQIGGRFEKIHSNPHIYIDGAHNPDAIIKLKDTIDMVCGDEKVTFIMGVLSDKDYDTECEIIASRADNIVTVTSKNKRALSGIELLKTIQKYNANVEYVDDILGAVVKAIGYGNKYVIAFGSLSYLGELKEAVNRLDEEGII